MVSIDRLTLFGLALTRQSGFEVDSALRSGGIGLPGMYERAEQMGGELAVHSNPGEGTQVRVVVRCPMEEGS